MAIARERLRQLTIAQESFQEETTRTREVLEDQPLPRGAGIFQRPISGEEAERLLEEGVPGSLFQDIFETVLNNFGIQSERQRRGFLEERLELTEAANLEFEAVREHLGIIASKGVGATNVDLLREARANLQSGFQAINLGTPEAIAQGRTLIAESARKLDSIDQSRQQLIQDQRTRFNNDLGTISQLARQDSTQYNALATLLTEHAKQFGPSANASRQVKDAYAKYLDISAFGQAAQQATAFGIPIASFDPTEQTDIGTLIANTEAFRQGRQLSFTNQQARILQDARKVGLVAADKDGRLTLNELVVPELAPLINESRFNQRTPVTPGLPTERTVDQSIDAITNLVGGIGNRILGGDDELNFIEKGGSIGADIIESFFPLNEDVQTNDVPPGMMKAHERPFIDKILNPMPAGKVIPRRRETNDD